MEILNLKDKINFLEEVAELEYDEWADNKKENRTIRIGNKINRIKKLMIDKNFCKLILLSDSTLVGFISIFEHDCHERMDLSPWYATMYVKEKYRGRGYSKMLNDAIIKEAFNRGFEKLYLKTDLENYYEKFGAQYIKKLSSGEKLYYIKTK